MRRVSGAFIGLVLGLLAAGCADILGLDPLGPAVRDDEQEPLPDAAAEAAPTTSDASDQ